MDVRVGLSRKLSAKELMLLNCGVGEDLRVPWTTREIQPVHPKADQSWMFVGRTDDEAETLILWPPDSNSWLIWKDPDAGKDWGQKEKGTTEDEMLGWHHRLNGHEFEQTPGADDGQGRPGVLQTMGSQRVGHDWATELNCRSQPCDEAVHSYVYSQEKCVLTRHQQLSECWHLF